MAQPQFITWFNRSSFYLSRRVYITGFTAAALFVLSYFLPPLYTIALAVLLLLLVCVVIDTILLYTRKGVSGKRWLPERLSNGDENRVVLDIHNRYSFPVNLILIDELPLQFQERKWIRKASVDAGASREIEYLIKPQERGEYSFGKINVYASTILNIVRRRIILDADVTVKVYPSFIQMRRYELLGVAARSEQMGVKRMRKLGHSMEFEQIKEYVRGDDYRTINWKATARRGDLMVNNYTDERSQQIYCIINKGRVMKMPFEGLTLLDYAINAALVLLNTALQKHDKAGLITFSENLDTFVGADKKPGQLNDILDTLYRQKTAFLEPDFEKLFSIVRNRITQRSLLVLFTNFESLESLDRELPSLKRLAHYHLLMVVLFENTELKQLTETPAKTTEDIYIRTIAEKYRHEKYLIVKELQKHGIVAVLSTPQRLTVNALNKYLELKNRSSI
jgi:uncharacterized protein (DUF58 family)